MIDTDDKRVIAEEDRLLHLYELGILTWDEVITVLNKYLKTLEY